MNFKTIMAGLLFAAGCTMMLSSCSSDDDSVFTESQTTVAPLKVSVASDETRVLIEDGNGWNSTVKMLWEEDDALWAYSPDYENADGTKGGYTRLKLASAEGSNTAEFVADGASHYVPGKPLFIYYHGGDQSTSFASKSADGSFLTLKRPYDKGAATSSAMFKAGPDAYKSMKANPMFLRSCYMASAPSNGEISGVVLKGNSTLMTLRFPADASGILNGLMSSTTYKVSIAYKTAKSDVYRFPNTIELYLDAAGKLTSKVTEYGTPLVISSGNGVLNFPEADEFFAGGNNRIYFSLPADTYKDFGIDVTVSREGDGEINGVVVKEELLNKNFYYSHFNGKTFTIDINNGGKNNADKVYNAGNVWSKFDADGGFVPAGDWKEQAPSILATK